MTNTGSTAIFYKWVQIPAEHLFEDSRVCIATQKYVFHVMETCGSTVPGEMKEFLISFKSMFVGEFMERWVLCTSPIISTNLQTLFLKAIITLEDTNWELCMKLDMELEQKQIIHAVEEAIDDILINVDRMACSSFGSIPDYMFSLEAFQFMSKIIDHPVPAYYSPSLKSAFQELALDPKLPDLDEANLEDEAYLTNKHDSVFNFVTNKSIFWNGSLGSISKETRSLHNESYRLKFGKAFAELGKFAAIPPHPTAIFLLGMYKVVSNVTSSIGDIIESTKVSFSNEFSGNRSDQKSQESMETINEDPLQTPLEVSVTPKQDISTVTKLSRLSLTVVLQKEFPGRGTIPTGASAAKYHSEDLKERYECSENISCLPELLNKVKEHLDTGFCQFEDGVEFLKATALSNIDQLINEHSTVNADASTCWKIFVLERQKYKFLEYFASSKFS
ncbi:hypothetical protein O6H91_05G081200 [Diphasiastrum complanatum]|nr:hypothetical protein O6H91_05G081200 [Diphasiastrum complanatum]